MDDGFVGKFGAEYKSAKRRMARCEDAIISEVYRFAKRLASGKGITVDGAGQWAESLAVSYKRYRRARDEFVVLDRLADEIGFNFDYEEEYDE